MNKYSILTVIEVRPSVSESSTRITKFYVPTASELKFRNTGIKNWLLPGIELVSTTTILYSTAVNSNLNILYTDPLSLEITLQTFHFFETTQVFSNPKHTTQSGINPSRKKNKPSLAQSSTRTKLCHFTRGMSEGKLSNHWGSKKKSRRPLLKSQYYMSTLLLNTNFIKLESKIGYL